MGNNMIVLGAGADVAMGLPLVNGLIPALAKFTSNNGKGHEIHNIIKTKLPNLRFSFDKFVDKAVEEFLERQLKNPTLYTDEIKLLKTKFTTLNSEKIDVFVEILERIETINDANKIPEDLSEKICRIAYPEAEKDLSNENLIKLRGIQFTRSPQTAIENMLLQAIQSRTEDNDLEKAFNNYLVNKIFGFETLLVEYFTGFYTNNMSAIKKYLYMSWVLWAYLRISNIEGKSNGGIYEQFANLPKDTYFLTFNYTNFFKDISMERVSYFHGNCESYLRFDTRQFIGPEDDRIKNATDINKITELIDSIFSEMDLEKNKYYIPSIIPPLAFKPLISLEYLENWYNASRNIADAERIIVVGYSFNYVDEHFNDLIRKKAYGKKIIVVNPDIFTAKEALSKLLGISIDNFNKTQKQGFDAEVNHNIILLRAKAEEIDLKELIASN